MNASVKSTGLLDKRSATSGFLLERTAKRMKQAFQRELQAAGADITVDQWVVLQELDREDGQPQLAIAQAVYKDAATLTRIIDLLCQKELTRRVVDPEDRRRFLVELTEAGRAKIAEVKPLVRAFRRRAWQELDNEQMDRLVDALNRIFDNLSPKS
jgi:DNA-binding MarR family transcriptional regulator